MSGFDESAMDLWARPLLDTPEDEDWWDTCLSVRYFSIDESDAVLCALEDLADVVETLAFSEGRGDDRVPVTHIDATTANGAVCTVSDFGTYRHLDVDGTPIIVWADSRPSEGTVALLLATQDGAETIVDELADRIVEAVRGPSSS